MRELRTIDFVVQAHTSLLRDPDPSAISQILSMIRSNLSATHVSQKGKSSGAIAAAAFSFFV